MLMQYADLSLAQRLEDSDSRINVSYAETLKLLKPDASTAVNYLASGTAVYVGNEHPLSRTVGLGIAGELSSTELDAVEDFYRSRNASVQIDLCPLAHPSLMKLLGERGYQFAEFLNFWYLPLANYEPPQASAG